MSDDVRPEQQTQLKARCNCGSDTYHMDLVDTFADDHPVAMIYCADCGSAVGRFEHLHATPLDVIQYE